MLPSEAFVSISTDTKCENGANDVSTGKEGNFSNCELSLLIDSALNLGVRFSRSMRVASVLAASRQKTSMPMRNDLIEGESTSAISGFFNKAEVNDSIDSLRNSPQHCSSRNSAWFWRTLAMRPGGGSLFFSV